jgi:hypothetical protein
MEQAKLTECSFKPQTLDYPLANQGSGDKNMDLYSKVKKRQYADKKTLPTDEYEMRKAPEEYKFAPSINQGVNTKIRDANEIPGYDKVRERLERARQEKLQKELMTGRGIPSQMKAKIEKQIPDTGFQMTHKPSKFATSFGAEGSQLIPKKGQPKASPEPVVRTEPKEAPHRIHSNRSGKSQKKPRSSPKQKEAHEQPVVQHKPSSSNQKLPIHEEKKQI